MATIMIRNDEGYRKQWFTWPPVYAPLMGIKNDIAEFKTGDYQKQPKDACVW